MYVLTDKMDGLCKNTSAGKSCSITLQKNSQECMSTDGCGGLCNDSSTDFNT